MRRMSRDSLDFVVCTNITSVCRLITESVIKRFCHVLIVTAFWKSSFISHVLSLSDSVKAVSIL